MPRKKSIKKIKSIGKKVPQAEKKEHKSAKKEAKQSRIDIIDPANITFWKATTVVFALLFMLSIFTNGFSFINDAATGASNSEITASTSPDSQADPAAASNTSQPATLSAIIISDERCGSQCDTTQLALQLEGVLPGLVTRNLDYSEDEAKDIIESAGIEYLPAVLFDDTVTESEGYERVEGYLVDSGEYLSLQIGASFDPEAEICDNGIDDNADGETDCDDTDCQGEWKCMQKLEKPEVELFVMSHCPYGTQIEKGILPVLELLGDKIEYSVKFCTYAMHGKKELDEQILQHCIQKDHKEKYLAYLRCFLKEGKSEECVEEAGIDNTALELCIKATDEEYKITENYNDESTWLSGRFPIFDIYKESNEKYGIRGSPGFVVNGVVAQAGRDSKSLLEAICTGFEEKPSECDEELSSSSPTPGFGFESTGTASTDSGCGA